MADESNCTQYTLMSHVGGYTVVIPRESLIDRRIALCVSRSTLFIDDVADMEAPISRGAHRLNIVIDEMITTIASST